MTSVDEGGGTPLSSVHSAPSELGVGDAMIVDLGDSVDGVIDFSGVGSSAGFILAIGSYNESGTSTQIQLSPDISLPEIDPSSKSMVAESESVPDDDGFGPQEILSAWLRASEQNLAEVKTQNEGVQKSMSIKSMGVGEVESFRVLSNLTSVNNYVEVRGFVKCVADSVVLYVDSRVGDDVLSEADITTLCDGFNRVAAEEQELFGQASDVDGDGKIHVFMTPQINKLGALGGGIVTGYFYAGDLMERSDSNPVSNYREIIYTMVPDDAGQYGYAIAKSFAMSNLLPAVFPHELQHAISYAQHVFSSRGVPEENWLNEGMSHLAEDLMGYNTENPSRYSLFLASPSTYGVITQASPNLMERGAAYLFLRFLYEQAQNKSSFLKSMEQSALRGVANLEAAFAGPQELNEFKEFISRWVLALAMTDRGISQDSRFTYQPRTRHPATSEWTGVCLNCNADDNRGTQLTGINLNPYNGYHSTTVDGGTAKFYDVSTPPAVVRIAGSAGGGNFAALIRYQ